MQALINNRYAIVQVLGMGPFSKTFFAEDVRATQPSRRWCILKQYEPLVSASAERLVQEQFRQRAATLTKLSREHPDIPHLYHSFAKDGLLYLVLQWVQGVSLGDLIRQRGPMGEADVRSVLIRSLTVLEHVHRRNLLHGEIQPDHIILRQSDNQPILINFGEFKELLDGRPLNGHRLSRPAIAPSVYMPVEQRTGRPTPASDLYSLGLTAIYLLTGGLPHDLESMERGLVKWHRYAPGISSDLVHILNRAIQFHWRDRYSSAQKMLKDLQVKSRPVRVAASQVRSAAPGAMPAAQSPVSVRPLQRPVAATTSVAQARPVATRPVSPMGMVESSTMVLPSRQSELHEWSKALVPGSVLGILLIVAYVLMS